MEFYAEFGSYKLNLLDIIVFLATELIARKGDDLKAFVAEIIMQLNQLLVVLGGKASF